MTKRKPDLGSVLDLVQPDHPWFEAMTRPHRDAVAKIEKGMRDAAAGRSRAARLREADELARTGRKAIKPTAEREARPDMRPGLIARYASRNEITKTQATAAVMLRRDYWIGEGDEVRGRLVASYGDAPPRQGGSYEPSYTGAQSRAAYERALAYLDDPEHQAVVVHVVIEDRSARSWAEARIQSVREASTIGIRTLRKALDRLSQHYQLGAA